MLSTFFRRFLMENTCTHVGMAFAALGGLLSDGLADGTGYFLAFGMAILLIGCGLIREWRLYRLYRSGTIHIPVIISVEDSRPTHHMLKRLAHDIAEEYRTGDLLKALKDYCDVSPEMLRFQYACDLFDEEKLISFLRIIRYQLDLISHSIEERIVFHVACYRRPAVALAVGGMFRSDSLCIYQNNDAKDRFDKVAVVDERRYKESLTAYEKVTVEESFEGESDTLLLGLQLASHNLSLNHPDLAQYHHRVVIRAKTNGTIPVDDDWVRYAQEIYHTINTLPYRYKEIVLIHAMPEAIALILGMALENYWPITVTQFHEGGYRSLVHLRRIKYYNFF